MYLVCPRSWIPSLTLKEKKLQGVVAYTSNPSIQEAEAGGSRVPGQAGLQSEYLKTKPRLHWFLCLFSGRVSVRPPPHPPDKNRPVTYSKLLRAPRGRSFRMEDLINSFSEIYSYKSYLIKFTHLKFTVVLSPLTELWSHHHSQF